VARSTICLPVAPFPFSPLPLPSCSCMLRSSCAPRCSDPLAHRDAPLAPPPSRAFFVIASANQVLLVPTAGRPEVVERECRSFHSCSVGQGKCFSFEADVRGPFDSLQYPPSAVEIVGLLVGCSGSMQTGVAPRSPTSVNDPSDFSPCGHSSTWQRLVCADSSLRTARYACEQQRSSTWPTLSRLSPPMASDE
jgi:hypothetical protein